MYRKSRMLAFVIVVIGMTVSASVLAAREIKFAIGNIESFDRQVSDVHGKMLEGGGYAGIQPKERAQLDSDFSLIRELLERKFASGKLDDRDQVDLANAQERANAILTRNDSDRLVCTYDKRTGSNFKFKHCMSISDREAARRKSIDGYQSQLMGGRPPVDPASICKPTDPCSGVRRGL